MQARTLADLVAQLGNLGNRELFRHRSELRTFSWSFEQVGSAAYRSAALLHTRGVKKGDRVMIWGPNSPEWAVVFFGCLLQGAVPVPIDLRFRPPFLQEVHKQTEARLLFSSRFKPDPQLGIPTILLEGLEQELRGVRTEQFEPPRVAEDDLAEILFTSGTTAQPKGVILTHRNLISELEGFQPVVPQEPEYRFLSVLPLSHIFEQMGGLLLPIARGGTVIYIGAVRPAALMRALQEEQPNMMMVVPRLLELLRDRVLREARAIPLGPQLLLLLMNASRALPPSTRRNLYWPLRRQLGSRLKYLVSGGAALPVELERFWDTLGMVVLQGYGLTETSSAVTCNRVEDRRIGSVGKTLHQQEAKLAEDGEILVRGPNVTPGYYGKPDLTAAAFEDGWLKTGDLGVFDQDGFLKIKGRKKEVIVTSSGINVYPEDVEGALARVRGVKDAAAVEWRGRVHAVLLLADGVDPQRVVRKANNYLDESQKIRDYTVWPRPDFPRTATMKVRKESVLEFLRGRNGESSGAFSLERGGAAVSQLVAELAPGSATIVESGARLGIDLGMGSIEQLELVSRIEQELGAELPEEEIGPETTVGQLERMVERESAGKSRVPFPGWAFSSAPAAVREFVQRWIIHPGLRLCCPLTVVGQENLRGLTGPYLLAANHTSMLDAPVILEALHVARGGQTAVAAWAEYFEAPGQPLIAKIVRRLEYYLAAAAIGIVPLPQTRLFRPSLRHVGSLMDRGWRLLIFPEGSRTRTGETGPFKEGVGVMASWLRTPVVPVKVEGLFAVLPTGRRFPRRGKVTVRFGQPLTFSATDSYLDISRQLQEAVRRL